VDADRRRVLCADAALVVVVGEALLALVGGLRSGLTKDELVSDGLVLSNAVLGLSLALGGYPIARLRPGHRVGWMLLAAGMGFATSAAGFATLAWLASPGSEALGWRMLADLTNLGWSLAITFFLPLTLLLFPDGKLPSRRWRPVVFLAAVNAAMLGPQVSGRHRHRLLGNPPRRNAVRRSVLRLRGRGNEGPRQDFLRPLAAPAVRRRPGRSGAARSRHSRNEE
jgi:hypothetical protein